MNKRTRRKKNPREIRKLVFLFFSYPSSPLSLSLPLYRLWSIKGSIKSISLKNKVKRKES